MVSKKGHGKLRNSIRWAEETELEDELLSSSSHRNLSTFAFLHSSSPASSFDSYAGRILSTTTNKPQGTPVCQTAFQMFYTHPLFNLKTTNTAN